MKNEGFTLIELLVVIVIIGVLSIVVVPSVINVNKNINERLYNNKKEYIENAATLYASNNEDIFNGTDEVKVYVYELIKDEYITVDVSGESESSNCTTNNEKGCMINPIDKSSMNEDYVILTKVGAGVQAKYVAQGETTTDTTNGTGNTLVEVVCERFASGSFEGHTGDADNPSGCKCDNINNPTKLVDNSGNEVDFCIIAGGEVNNYLRYGSSSDAPNWRVIGLYKVNGKLSAKMITSDAI